MGSSVQETVSFLEDVAKGERGQHIEIINLDGLHIIHANPGSIRCRFTVHTSVSDENGNWHTGAMTTMMDMLAGAAVTSVDGRIFLSVDLNVSFFSTAKIQEDVEIEAKAVGTNQRLKSAVIEIRRKGKGELIALGRLWSIPISINPAARLSEASKL